MALELSFPLPKISTVNTLMDLRIMTLRMIADIWLDDKVLDSERCGWQTLLDKGIIDACALKHLCDDKNAIPVYKSTLRETILSMTVEELERYFIIRFGYNFPFLNFSLKYIAGFAQWNLYGDNMWTKAQEEVITLNLPKPSPDWNAYEKNDKLTEYYEHFPSMMGTLKVSSRTEESTKVCAEGSDPNSEAASPYSQFFTPVPSFGGNDYHLGTSDDSFLSFGAVINKVIATAWDNDQLLQQIDYASPTGSPRLKENDAEYYANLKMILKDHFDYEFPWDFKLKLIFVDTPAKGETGERDAFWRQVDSDNSKKIDCWKWNERYSGAVCEKTYYKGFLRNTVEIEIPEGPASLSANISLALAKYNAVGPAYPFTCS